MFRIPPMSKHEFHLRGGLSGLKCWNKRLYTRKKACTSQLCPRKKARTIEFCLILLVVVMYYPVTSQYHTTKLIKYSWFPFQLNGNFSTIIYLVINFNIVDRESIMFLYGLTLQRGGQITCCCHGQFSGTKQQVRNMLSINANTCDPIWTRRRVLRQTML